MRLRQLDKEYTKCTNFDIKDTDFEYQGLNKVLGLPEETEEQKRKKLIEKQLQMFDMKDLTACNVRSEMQKAADQEEAE